MEDFTWTYADEHNVPRPYTIPSQEMATFPEYLADHLAKHLAQKIVQERGIKVNYDDDFKEVLQEIYVTL